jgi:hypothetical protein
MSVYPKKISISIMGICCKSCIYKVLGLKSVKLSFYLLFSNGLKSDKKKLVESLEPF